ncbi:MAG: hypothetical protein Q7J98_02620 [Kiritimatiellia bacterium]|nr:hypothetical protein [Kiritimatiellia bacterium]
MREDVADPTHSYGPGAIFPMWALVICLGIALGCSLRHKIDVLWIHL